jgi:hypothetical protein
VIPDAQTAIAVGSAILHAYFPAAAHVRNSPGLGADDKGIVWKVYEKLQPNMLGGGPTVELDKNDGRVVAIYLTQ